MVTERKCLDKSEPGLSHAPSSSVFHFLSSEMKGMLKKKKSLVKYVKGIPQRGLDSVPGVPSQS